MRDDGRSVPEYCEPPRESPLDDVVLRAVRVDMEWREAIGRIITDLPPPDHEALKDYMAYELLLKARDLVGIARVGELCEWVAQETTAMIRSPAEVAKGGRNRTAWVRSFTDSETADIE